MLRTIDNRFKSALELLMSALELVVLIRKT
jgi:hypothetical protein